MHHARHFGKLSVALLVVGSLYAGYRLDVARRDAEFYKREYGYRTATTGLTDRVIANTPWEGILIDSAVSFTDGAHNLNPIDIDNDGALELVAGSFRSDTLMTYDRAGEGRDLHRWTRHIIDRRVGGGFARRPVTTYLKARLKEMLTEGYIAGGAHYTAISDLNSDGKADLVVAGDEMRNDVVWYEQAGGTDGEAPSWRKHVAYRNDSHRTYHVEAGDIDGDGDRDIVFTTKLDNSLGWLENQGSPGAWPPVMIDSNCVRCFNAGVVDIDGDGRSEIIASEDSHASHGKICLYAHRGHPRNAQDWRKRYIAQLPSGHGLGVFKILDLDGDGALDIAAAGHQGDVCILRNPQPADVSGPWDIHFAARGSLAKGRNFREIDVGDIDLDGDPDIVVADEAQNAVVWYENPSMTFCEDWPEHVVDQSNVYLRWCHSVRLADMDNDGDPDIAVAAAASNVFLLYVNGTTPGDGTQAASLLSAGK